MVREDFILKSNRTSIDLKWVDLLYKQLQYVIDNGIPEDNIVFISIYGSQNYKLDNVNSDVDCACLIFPSIEDFYFIQQPISKEYHTDIGHIVVKDIRVAFNEIRKSSPNMLEVFASDYVLVNRKYEKLVFPILDNIDILAKYNVYKLLHGLEGLYKRYLSEPNNPKYIANSLRITYLIEAVINNKSFKESLVPINHKELYEIKMGIVKNKHMKEVKTEQMLQNYYNTHKDIQPDKAVKNFINSFQRTLMEYYTRNIMF